MYCILPVVPEIELSIMILIKSRLGRPSSKSSCMHIRILKQQRHDNTIIANTDFVCKLWFVICTQLAVKLPAWTLWIFSASPKNLVAITLDTWLSPFHIRQQPRAGLLSPSSFRLLGELLLRGQINNNMITSEAAAADWPPTRLWRSLLAEALHRRRSGCVTLWYW